jgi:hypothetical protein
MISRAGLARISAASRAIRSWAGWSRAAESGAKKSAWRSGGGLNRAQPETAEADRRGQRHEPATGSPGEGSPAEGNDLLNGHRHLGMEREKGFEPSTLTLAT